MSPSESEQARAADIDTENNTIADLITETTGDFVDDFLFFKRIRALTHHTLQSSLRLLTAQYQVHHSLSVLKTSTNCTC